MANTLEAADEKPPSRSRKHLILAVIIAFLGGGAGFYVTFTGILRPAESLMFSGAAPSTPAERVEFVALDPLVISLGPNTGARHLKFSAQLDVNPAHIDEVVRLRPRIIDVLNGYLRAIEPADLEGPAALTRMRTQMLRRIQIVTGEGRVRDLLVMEFVLN
jgi:flagellar protein FliL